jgi:hypothetical protein
MEFFGSASVNPSEEFFDLVLEHGDFALCGLEFFGKFLILERLLLDDSLSLFGG